MRGPSEGIARALDRATGARPIPGNSLVHHPDSPRALEEMLALIAGATRWIHFENYIIRGDHTGRRFAAALGERAAAGVRVRVLYDALGSAGTRWSYWHGLRRAGADVRAFNPLLSGRPLRLLRRDHRKLVVADGGRAMVGGLCIGDEWAGDPRRHRQPWRDTMLEVCGPAAAALDGTFARVWRRAGPPLPADELDTSPAECGGASLRVVEGVPARSRVWRAVQLLAASARERLWITDAYLVAPTPLFAALVDAARDGVDVRLLLPGTSDLPVLRTMTRVGYRDLLNAGVRIFEWDGPMLHAKTLVVDREFVRIGSSNLNVSSLVENYELDVIAEHGEAATALAEQFRRDHAGATEVVLAARRLRLPPRLVDAPAPVPAAPPLHKRSGRELRQTAVRTLGQVAGGLRRRLAATTTLVTLLIGVLLVIFPRVMSITFAAGAFVAATAFGWYTVASRPGGDDVP